MFDRSSERKVKRVAVGHKNQDEQEMLNSRVAVAATVEVDDNFSTGWSALTTHSTAICPHWPPRCLLSVSKLSKANKKKSKYNITINIKMEKSDFTFGFIPVHSFSYDGLRCSVQFIIAALFYYYFGNTCFINEGLQTPGLSQKSCAVPNKPTLFLLVHLFFRVEPKIYPTVHSQEHCMSMLMCVCVRVFWAAALWQSISRIVLLLVVSLCISEQIKGQL